MIIRLFFLQILKNKYTIQFLFHFTHKNMSFINKIIPSKKILLIDVGTYKVKAALCEYKNNEVFILNYAEKKQEASDILNGEITNIEWVSNTIEQTLNKILQNEKVNPHDIIINIPTTTIISSSKELNYTRSKSEENINIDELDYIVAKAEREALSDAKQQIYNKTWYTEVDMKLITSSITDINIDGFRVTNPLWFTGKNIKLSLLNIFIPASKYNIMNTIWNYLNKNILSIIPLEFSIPKLIAAWEYAYDDILFIDIGNTKSSIIIQKAGVILWFDKIHLWIHDLIKTIKEKTNETTIEIIKNLQKSNMYQKEKQDFLEIWEEWFIISIKEILKSHLVPHKIFLSGWGDNEFIRTYIENIDLSKHLLHTLKPFVFIQPNYETDIDIQWDKDIFNKTNLWLLSMILASKDIVQYKNNPLLSLIKNFLEKNEL